MSANNKKLKKIPDGSMYSKNLSKLRHCKQNSDMKSDVKEEKISEIKVNSKDHKKDSIRINSKLPKYQIRRAQTVGITYQPEKQLCRSKSSDTLDPRNGLEKFKQTAISYKIAERSLKDLGFERMSLTNWSQKNKLLQKPNLYDLLREMIDNYIKPSLLVCIGKSRYSCHLIVLQCYSQFFRDCCTEFVIFLPETKISSAGFEAVYEWMIKDSSEITRDKILELYRAAQFLGVEDLLNQCWALIGDEDIFVEDMAFLLFVEATTYDLQLIQNMILPRIYKFFLVAVSSQDFINIKAEDVILLLSSNSIGVNSEMEVFFSAVRWLNFDWKNRKSYAQKLMECIRFALMPPWFLVTLEKVELGLEVNRVIHHVNITKNISEGLAYVTTLKHFSGNEDDMYKILKKLSLSKPPERNWILDSRCLHHHNMDCPRMRLLTYKGFLAYLLTLHKREKDYWKKFIPTKSMQQQCCQFCYSSNIDLTAEPNEFNNFMNLKNFGELSSVTTSKEFFRTFGITDKNNNQFKNGFKKILPTKSTLKVIGDTLKTALINCEEKNLHKTNMDIGDRYSNVNEHEAHTGPDYRRQNDQASQTHNSNFTCSNNHQFVESFDVRTNNQHGSKILIFGGLDPILKQNGRHLDVHGNSGNNVIIYDNQLGKWKYLSEIPCGPRRHFCAVECGGKVYVLGGTLMKNNQLIYETNVWSFDSNTLEWAIESKIPITGKNFSIVAVKGKQIKNSSCTNIYGRGLYVIGGQDAQGRVLNTVWFFDVVRRIWTKKSSLIIPRYGCMAAVINNELIVAGGIVESTRENNYENNIAADEEFTLNMERKLTITNSVEFYCFKNEHLSNLPNNSFSYNLLNEHLSNNKWYISKHHLPEPRVYGRLCLCSDNNLYLSGGISRGKNQSFKTLGSIDRYSFDKHEWRFFSKMDLARYGHDMVEYKNSLVIVGGVHGVGHDYKSLKEIFMYDLQNNKILNKIKSLPWPLSGCSVIVSKIK